MSSSISSSVTGAASRKVWSMVYNTKRLVGAALLRKRTLCLGGVASGFPSSLPNLSSAFASATPYPTNMFIVAHGEREGLWHGARLEMYGSLVRLIRSKYYAIPTSETNHDNESSSKENVKDKMEILNAITVQLNRIYQLFDKVDSGQMSCASLNSVLAENDKSNCDVQNNEVSSNNEISNVNTEELNNAEEQREAAKWHLIWTDTNQMDSTTNDNYKNDNIISENKKSSKHDNNENKKHTAVVNWDEEVIAQWFRSSRAEFDIASINTPEGNNINTQNFNSNNNNTRIVDKAIEENDLLMENGICFALPNEAGLRVMRAARLAFLARVETCIASFKNGTFSSTSSSSSSLSDSDMSAANTTTSSAGPSYNARGNISYSFLSAETNDHSEGESANRAYASPFRSTMTSLNREDSHNKNNKRRRTFDNNNSNRNMSERDEESNRPLSILDVSEVDSSCSQTAMQCVAEAGLISEEQCQLTFVPLSLQATLHLSNEMRTSLRIMMPRANKLHDNPFDCLPLYSCDVAAYTSYIELTLPRLSSSSCSSTNKSKNSFFDSTSIRIRREDASSRLAMALMTLRRGAAVLITFIPTAQSVMEYCRVMELRTQYLEVSREAQLIKDAKRIVAMAISKSGRWSYITDEILPAVDAPQGSAFSLMVIIL